MSTIVNFTIPDTLNKQVQAAIMKKGFASKAEFFRFAAIKALETSNRSFRNADEEIDFLSEQIGKHVARLMKNKKLPSAREQLKNL